MMHHKRTLSPYNQFNNDRRMGNKVNCGSEQCDLILCLKGVAPVDVHRHLVDV